ncbi:restriction endonuclease subunit S [uncultured Duodenibacillus sp.]|uniref:restriction endonuclease subunit S n=1 Tax=uncultured Duodenibacillus sp. TaxID=1980699 RepID=UPI00258706A3|nr:restriction endonuclease subunit S [uncultured Duodenibacillus sp.]
MNDVLSSWLPTQLKDGWRLTKNREFCSIVNGYPCPSEGFNTNGEGIPIVRIRDITSGSTNTYFKGEYPPEQIINTNDLLIGMDGDFNVRLWSSGKALLNQRCCNIRCKDELIKKYLYFVLPIQLKIINELKNSTTVKHLNNEDILDAQIVIPNKYDHISKIVNYLDSKTKCIDRILSALNDDLEKIIAYRQSLITRAVTKGLDPNVEMKDSGVEWIGNIPKNWLIPTLSHVCRSMRNGYVGPTDGLFVPDGIKYVQSLHVKNGEIDFSVKEYYVREEWAKTHPKLRKGNLVIVQTGDIGQVGVVRQNLHNSNCHALIICDIKDDICNVDFLSFYFQSKPGKELLLLTKTGLGLPHLNTGKVCYCKVPLPPLEEQKRISIYCSNIERQICKAEKTIRETILKLKEYRSSLISAAVTGQLVIDEAAE